MALENYQGSGQERLQASGDFSAGAACMSIRRLIKPTVSNNIHKGFYFLLGPRVTIITSVKDEDGKKIEDFYKGSNFGGQGGFGYNILNFLAVELLADVTVSDPLEFEYDSQKLFAAFINLNFNLESLINK